MPFNCEHKMLAVTPSIQFRTAVSMLTCLLSVTGTRCLPVCDGYAALYPTIYQQLTPFMGGVYQNAIDAAAESLMLKQNEGKTKSSDSAIVYDDAAARSLPAHHPDFPWTHPYYIKVVSLDGQLYLPGGLLSVGTMGFSFKRNRNPFW